MKWTAFLAFLLVDTFTFLSFAQAQTALTADQNSSTHSAAWPSLGVGSNPQEVAQSLEMGPELSRNLSPLELIDQRRRLNSSLSDIERQTPGSVDAYVISIALDSDPVFAREAREVGTVLARRYGASRRLLVLSGQANGEDDLPHGSISSLMVALASIAEKMDREEDVLVLYSTSHGTPQGLAYHYGNEGYGILSPKLLKEAFEELGIQRRIILLSACYSGIFVPFLDTDETAIITASAANRTSFGCQPDNDWTFFGDALVNRALRKKQGLLMAHREAVRSIADWESRMRLPASLPQARIGVGAQAWLSVLEANIPISDTDPVGRPSIP